MPRRRVFYNVGLSLFRYCEIRRQLERELLTVPRGGTIALHSGPHGEAPGLARKQKEQGETRGNSFSMVSMGKAR